MSPEPAGRRRWLLLAGVWAVYAAFGLTLGSTAAFLPAIRADLGLSRTDMGLILGTWQFVYLGASIPAGRLIDRVGLRSSLAAAAVCIAASALLRSAATGFWSLLFAVAVFGLGGPLISIGAPKLVAGVFTDLHRRTAVGIYGTGPAIGSAVGLAASNSLVRPLLGDSWRAGLVLYSAVAAGAGLFWFAIARDRLADAEDEVAVRLSSRELLQLPVVRLVLVIAIGAFFYSHTISNWLVEILEDSGWSAEAAGYWASLPTLLGILVTLSVPRFAAANRRVPILATAMVLAAVGTVFIGASTAGVLAPALAASGIARSSIMPICMLVLMDHREVGARNMAAVGGLFFTAAEIGGVTGPAVTGILSDLTGGFTVPLRVLAAVMACLAVFTVAFLGRNVGADDGLSRR